jgi:hypothetical protein
MCKQSSHEDADQSIFSWPQTTLTCVNRRNRLHASNSSIYSQIGGVSLRYSNESQTYVIDGRRKTEDSKSSARNVIRSQYRWVHQDISLPLSNTEQDKDASIGAQPVQRAREYSVKWNHTRRKKLLKFAANRRTQIREQVLKAAMCSNAMAHMDISTPNLTIKQITSQANSLQRAASDESRTSIECSEKKKVTWWDIDNVTTETDEQIDEEEPIPFPTPIPTSGSKDRYFDESPGSHIPPPPPPPLQQPQIHLSYSDESSFTDDSPTCITADVSLYERRDAKDFVRVEKISTKGIMKTNQSKKGAVTWWDDRRNRHKPFLLKTDASIADDSVSSGMMGGCNIGLPSYAEFWGSNAFSFDSNDKDIIDTTSYTNHASKYLTGEFWVDKNEKLKMQSVKVRERVDEVIEKMKVMTVDLSEFVGEINCAPKSCGMNKKEMSKCMNAAAVFCRMNREEMKREERMNLPITEVIVIRSREDGLM